MRFLRFLEEENVTHILGDYEYLMASVIIVNVSVRDNVADVV